MNTQPMRASRIECSGMCMDVCVKRQRTHKDRRVCVCRCAVVEDDPVHGCVRMRPRQHYPMPRGSFTREWMMMDMMSAERRIGAGYRRMM